MGTTHEIDVEIALQNFRVTAFHSRRHGIADVRIEFVPVQAENLQSAAIQEKAIQFKLGVAESSSDIIIMDRFARDQDSGYDIVEVRGIDVPQFDILEI